MSATAFPTAVGCAARLRRLPLPWLLLACAALLAYRRVDQVLNPQFWAEDGAVFFLQSRADGAAAFLETSAGYLHTVLRFVAWVAGKFDVALAPALYVAAALILTLYVAARTQSRRFPLPPSPLYALAVVLIPDGYEVLLNLTNVQWILAAGLLLVLIAREPENTAQHIHDGLAVVALGLTGPFIIVLAPLFVWRAGVRRTRVSVVLAALAVLCAVVQTVVILQHPAASPAAPANLAFAGAVAATRIGGSLFAGGLVNATGGAGWVVVVAILGGIAWVALRGGPARWERLWLAVALVGLAVAGLLRCREAWPQMLNPGFGGRYFYLSQLLLLWLMVALTADPAPWVRRGALVAGLVFLTANLDRLREPPLPDLDWPSFAAQIRAGEEATVVINPANTEFHVPGRRPAPRDGRRMPAGAMGLVNASLRSYVTPARPAVLGFVIRGNRPRKVLVRAIGPSLAQFGVAEPLGAPVLRLQRNGAEVPGFASACARREPLEAKEAAERSGAFPLPPGTGDQVALVDLAAGSFSAIVSSAGGTGEVLLEVYEVPAAWYPTKPGRRAKGAGPGM